MNKRDVLEKMMVPIADRLPPDDENVHVLTWNPKTKYFSVQPANILCCQLRQIQTKEIFDKWKGKMDPHLYHTGYYVSHWCRLYPLSNAEADAGDIYHCEVCGSRQFYTPSGWTCENGHGGAESVEDDRPE